MSIKENKIPIKFYEELEDTINVYWDSLPENVKEALNKVYDKYYDKCEEKTND